MAAKECERRGLCRVGYGESYLRARLRRAEALGIGPDWTLRARPKTKKRARPSASARIVAAGRPSASIKRVAVIPDVHLCPKHPDHSRMEWLGRFCADAAPDEIVQLGDLGTFDSVNRHAMPGTLTFEQNPRMLADFDALQRGLDLFDKGAGNLRARRRITKGNHEYRLDKFEDLHPAAQGMFAGRFDEIANAHAWGVHPFNEYLFLEGVGFIHHPVNAMGRPYGGKTGPQRVANDSTFSIVHGHTHQRQSVSAPKMGGRAVRVISAGCALPWGHIEEYAKHSLTGWWWGVACLTIRDGDIIDEEWVSMMTLERRYRNRRPCSRVAK